MRSYSLPRESFLIPKREGKPYRVLLCDDKEISQLMGQNALESLGCLVDVAKDGEQAINYASQNRYDIIFMECSMPKVDGYEATARIKAEAKEKNGVNAGTPIVALTARVLLHDREKCIDSGMDDYIAKPARREVLCNAINKWCVPDADLIFSQTEW